MLIRKQFPEAQGNVLNCLVLFNERYKTLFNSLVRLTEGLGAKMSPFELPIPPTTNLCLFF